MATFHMDDLLAAVLPFDLTLEEEKAKPAAQCAAKGEALSRRDWLIAFGLFLRELHGPDVMGELALQEVIQSEHWYQHFIFDDTRFLGDIRPFARALPPHDLILVHLTRDGTSSEGDIGEDLWSSLPSLKKGIPRIGLKVNGAPEKLVNDLLFALDPMKEPIS